jgi:hypothetical protein
LPSFDGSAPIVTNKTMPLTKRTALYSKQIHIGPGSQWPGFGTQVARGRATLATSQMANDT